MGNEAEDTIIVTEKNKEAWKTYQEKLCRNIQEEKQVKATFSQMKPRKAAG